MNLSILAIDSGQAVNAALFYLFALMAAGSAVGVVVSRNIVRTAVCLLFTLAGVAGLYFLLSAEFLAAVQLVVYAGGTLILIVFGVMLTSKSPYSRFEPKPAEVIVALTVGAVLLLALLLAIPSAATWESVPPSSMSGAFADSSLPDSLRGKVSYDAANGRVVFRGRMTPEQKTALLKRVQDEQAAQTNMAASDPAAPKADVVSADAAATAAAIDRLSGRSQRFFFAEHPLAAGENYPITTLGQALLGDFLLPFEIVSVLLLAVMIGAAYLAKGRRHEEQDQKGYQPAP